MRFKKIKEVSKDLHCFSLVLFFMIAFVDERDWKNLLIRNLKRRFDFFFSLAKIK